MSRILSLKQVAFQPAIHFDDRTLDFKLIEAAGLDPSIGRHNEYKQTLVPNGGHVDKTVICNLFKDAREIIETAVWLLPASKIKNRLLRKLGHNIANSAYISPVLALNLDHVIIGDRCTIKTLNIFRDLRLLKLGDGVRIGRLNTISAFPGFRKLDPYCGCLIMDNESVITSRHYIDCSGGLEMGELSAFYGNRTTLLTHEIDTSTNEQTAGKVVISERSAVLTNCVVLKGAYLPPRSLLAANSTMIKSTDRNPLAGLYAGTPAKRIGPVATGINSWFERKTSATTQLRVDSFVARQLDG